MLQKDFKCVRQYIFHLNKYYKLNCERRHSKVYGECRFFYVTDYSNIVTFDFNRRQISV
jgi:hypothetical protein